MMNATPGSMAIPQRTPEARAQFVQATYVYLAVAIAGFGVASWFLVRWGMGEQALAYISAHRWSWLGVLLVYALLGAVCSSMARSASTEVAVLGLGFAVVLEAFLFSPLIALVLLKSGVGAIQSAALGTLLLVTALTLVVKVSGHDFSWMGVYLRVLGMLALGLIVSSILFGFSLGMVFCYVMLAFGAACVVYDTSRVLNEHTDETAVSAALELFGSIALVFWYMLRIFGDGGGASSDNAADDAITEAAAAPASVMDAAAATAGAESAAAAAETASSAVEATSAVAEGAASVVETVADVAGGAESAVKVAGGVIAGLASWLSS